MQFGALRVFCQLLDTPPYQSQLVLVILYQILSNPMCSITMTIFTQTHTHRTEV